MVKLGDGIQQKNSISVFGRSFIYFEELGEAILTGRMDPVDQVAAFGRLTPYFERLRRRLATPTQSSVPRTMW